MKSTGIIAEFNPFHNGHLYHLEETRKLTGSDFLIAVMSGDFYPAWLSPPFTENICGPGPPFFPGLIW